MLTSSQIRQSFLDFFKSKQHTIVPSSSLLPDAPNLLFTNAGMNQFVPIFLGQQKPDVSKWPGAVPGLDTRAADTQKCIRAGGKHNDLDDVGMDTYHLTFFEMLGNWSFGDYFKKESLEWGWELLTKVWKIPAKRLFATVYEPDKSKGDPAEFDQEAYDIWAEIFRTEGLDSGIHIIHGGKKDNFWMMGETGPCGPCSEIHLNLLPSDDEPAARALVNAGSQRCIEIWNHVFIQLNANPDGTYSPLPAKHVDTGMGFDRIAGFYVGTKGFTDFSRLPSAYETDIFRSIFDELEKLSGKKYASTLPSDGQSEISDPKSQIAVDIAFRVIADHIRTLSFGIADGIQPGNTDRNYVLRRILRRAVRYGRTLGFHEPFFYKLVDVLAETMGDVFPEIRVKKKQVQEVIHAEEEAFNRTLDRGIEQFEEAVQGIRAIGPVIPVPGVRPVGAAQAGKVVLLPDGRKFETVYGSPKKISAQIAFKLYDTYGFPLDLTELMARERGLSVDTVGFEKLMEEQRARGRAAQKKDVISLSQIESSSPTKFVGFDHQSATATVLELVSIKDKEGVILDVTPFYAEMGGQVGDTGVLLLPESSVAEHVVNTTKSGQTVVHWVHDSEILEVGMKVTAMVDWNRRPAIQRHHTVTHLLHWALHEVVSKEAAQKGSYVGPEKLTFDFNSAPLTPAQVGDIEKLVNERIVENAGVSWTEVPYADVKSRKDVMQFFGDKYGDTVRVVQIGGQAKQLDGFSMELCGGTHTRATGEIGLFRIVGEGAIAAGVRRIEAVAGLTAYDVMRLDRELIKTVAGKVNSPIHELEKKIESLLAQQKELEKQVKLAMQRNASNAASELLGHAQTVNGIPLITHNLGEADGDFLQAIADSLKGRFKGVIVLGGVANNAVSLVAAVTPDFTAKAQAGKIIQTIAPIVGGKGGGRPDNARGGGKDATKLDEALARARTLLG
jgi:alanyl-tRNA synthetase